MEPKHEFTSARARGKISIIPEIETDFSYVRKGCQRTRVDMSLFGSPVDHERKVITGQDIDFSSLEGSRLEALFSDVGWLPLVMLHEPVYPTLV